MEITNTTVKKNTGGISLQQQHIKRYPLYLYIIQSPDLTRNKEYTAV